MCVCVCVCVCVWVCECHYSAHDIQYVCILYVMCVALLAVEGRCDAGLSHLKEHTYIHCTCTVAVSMWEFLCVHVCNTVCACM